MGAMASFNLVWNRVIFTNRIIFEKFPIWNQGCAWNGTTSHKIFFPWDLTHTAQNTGTVVPKHVNFELCKKLSLKLVFNNFELKIIRHPLFSEVKVNTMRLILGQFIFFNLFLTWGHGLVLQLCLSQCAFFLLWL